MSMAGLIPALWAGTAFAGPTVELLTFGPGHDLVSQGGHAMLCVHDGVVEQARCTGYGMTDFAHPRRLFWDYARGQGVFWAAADPWERVLEQLGDVQDRDIWRQTLPIAPDAARKLAVALALDVQPDRRGYAYHHFDQNCTTRLRDHIDLATDGALRRGTEGTWGPTWREMTRETLAGQPLWLLPTELAGRSGDSRPTTWEAMAVPDVLRSEVIRRFDAEPEKLHTRQASRASGPGWLGQAELIGIAGLLGVAVWARRHVIVVVGLLGAALWLAAGISTHEELRWNEILLVWWPSDVALPWLSPQARRRYLAARAGGLAIATLAWIAGLLVQPLSGPLLVAALPLAAFVVGATPTVMSKAPIAGRSA